MSFYKSLCISNLSANNDTLRLFLEKTFMCEDKGMGESASFVSGYSHHFPEKYRKLEKNGSSQILVQRHIIECKKCIL